MLPAPKRHGADNLPFPNKGAYLINGQMGPVPSPWLMWPGPAKVAEDGVPLLQADHVVCPKNDVINIHMTLGGGKTSHPSVRRMKNIKI